MHLLRYSPKSNADATAALALVKKEEEDAKKVIEPWTNEPETLDELLDKYIVEAKFPGRVPGSTMFLVQSKARDGSSHQIVQGQKYKLFVATRLMIYLPFYIFIAPSNIFILPLIGKYGMIKELLAHSKYWVDKGAVSQL